MLSADTTPILCPPNHFADNDTEHSLIRLVSMLDMERKIRYPEKFKTVALEKTRLFLIRSMWSQATIYGLSHYTILSAIAFFNMGIHHYSRAWSIDFDVKFQTDCRTRDIYWLCAMTSLRIAVKIEERPETAWLVLGDDSRLFDAFPILKNRFTLWEVLEFEKGMNEALQGKLQVPTAFQFLEINLQLMKKEMDIDTDMLKDTSSYVVALMSFSGIAISQSDIAIGSVLYAIQRSFNEELMKRVATFFTKLYGGNYASSLSDIEIYVKARPVEASVLTKDKTDSTGRQRRLFG
eukprot:GHVH01004208.1.p1 GENE.GHVH01004208.1~~GHVH01004208.1.p1  ORF type:complete len:293 (+),score=33.04 GHVH01004208.1:871-1749(+)